MLDLYLNAIKLRLKNHKLVQESTLLKGDKWTKSGYDELSSILSVFLSEKLSDNLKLKMGTTISSKTLMNIYKGKYKLSYPIDPRTLNTLSKLVFFLGFNNWEDFIVDVEKKQKHKINSASPKVQVTDLVKKALASSFKVFNTLPELKIEPLKEFYSEDGSAIILILDLLNQKQRDNWSLSNTYNPSTFEILDIKVVEIKEDTAKVSTKEYWLLCWWDLEKNKYVKRFKNISDHYYLLIKEDDTWKIRADVSKADFNEIEEEVIEKEMVLVK